jgi:LEA14-like dessication related protein
VASNITPSMEKKPLMSWTWAQLSNNQRTSITILIKGKLKINVNFKPMGDPWAQLSNNQRTSIAILIKGKLKININFKPMGDPWAQPAHK